MSYRKMIEKEEMIRCPDCGLAVWTSKMKMHKSGECFVKIVSDLYEAGKEDNKNG